MEYKGYIQNVKPLNNGNFSFDLQGNGEAKRILCFSPQKRQNVEEKLKSPVKVKNMRLDNSDNCFIYDGDDNNMQTMNELEFDPINYEDVKLASIHLIANSSLFDITVKILSKRPTRIIKGKPLDVYCVTDGTAKMKFSDWEVSKLQVGQTYDMTNIKYKIDPYGNHELATPQRGFSAIMSQKKLDTSNITPEDPTKEDENKKGEILRVDKLEMYKKCSQCSKKVTAHNQKISICSSDACKDKPMKTSLLESGMFAHIIFVHNGREIKLTLFGDTIADIVPDWENKPKDDLKMELAMTDELELTWNNKMIITSAKCVAE